MNNKDNHQREGDIDRSKEQHSIERIYTTKKERESHIKYVSRLLGGALVEVSRDDSCADVGLYTAEYHYECDVGLHKREDMEKIIAGTQEYIGDRMLDIATKTNHLLMGAFSQN